FDIEFLTGIRYALTTYQRAVDAAQHQSGRIVLMRGLNYFVTGGRRLSLKEKFFFTEVLKNAATAICPLSSLLSVARPRSASSMRPPTPVETLSDTANRRTPLIAN